MPDDLTREETERIHTWLGTWKATQICDDWKECCHLSLFAGRMWEPHPMPMPPLDGDFRDVVAMKCLRKLADATGECFGLEYLPHGPQWHFDFELQSNIGVLRDDPTTAIFAAVLAYLKERGE